MHGCGRERTSCLKSCDGSAKAAAYVNPSSGEKSCRLHVAASSPVTEEFADRAAVGAGRLLAGSDKSPELAGSLGLRLPVFRLY
jgi:hypothetical protein